MDSYPLLTGLISEMSQLLLIVAVIVGIPALGRLVVGKLCDAIDGR